MPAPDGPPDPLAELGRRPSSIGGAFVWYMDEPHYRGDLPYRLPQPWFEALPGVDHEPHWWAQYADEAAAREAALVAWAALPEADRAAIRVTMLGRRLGASL